MLVEDDAAAFRHAAIAALGGCRPLTLESMLTEHALLSDRIARFGDCKDPADMWRRMGIERQEHP